MKNQDRKKHAYLIIAHNEPLVLKTLLRLLDHPLNDIFIHIDRRASALTKEIEHQELSFSQLHILQPQIPVYWGNVSQIEVELTLFETAHEHGEYAYYHLLSGVDLPIKTQDEIHQYFDEHQGEEFVGFWTDAFHQRDLKRKVYRNYIFTQYFKGGRPLIHSITSFLRNMYLALQKVTCYRRSFPYEPKKGYNWVSITHDFCSYLISKKEETLKLYKYSLCADEIFVQTLLYNSPFKEHVHNDEDAADGSMRAIDWERGNPYVWQSDDVETLLTSPYLFARKFSAQQIDAVQEIEKQLHAQSSTHH